MAKKRKVDSLGMVGPLGKLKMPQEGRYTAKQRAGKVKRYTTKGR